MRVELSDLPEWAQKQLLRKIKAQESGRTLPAPTAQAASMEETERSSAERIRAFPTVSRVSRSLAPTAGAAQRSKYGAQKDYRGAIRFDSKKEARRYDELMRLLEAGEIEDLHLQQQFTLQESYVTPEGERVRAVRYVADFRYLRKLENGLTETVVEDVKSQATRTQVYMVKKKLLKERYGITIQEF